MKKYTIKILLIIFIGSSYNAQSQDVNIKLAPSVNWLSGEQDENLEQFHLVGLAFGAGVIFPIHEGWFYNPMLLYSPGGQGYKSGDDFKYGICNN